MISYFPRPARLESPLAENSGFCEAWALCDLTNDVNLGHHRCHRRVSLITCLSRINQDFDFFIRINLKCLDRSVPFNNNFSRYRDMHKLVGWGAFMASGIALTITMVSWLPASYIIYKNICCFPSSDNFSVKYLCQMALHARSSFPLL